MMNQMASMVGPMTMPHGGGLRPGSMEPGMGIVEGHAIAHETGPAFGRTLGVGAEPARPVANMPLGHPMPQQEQAPLFPGYPQDMFMVMDDAVAKPETYGLRPGWSGGTMGMMTLVRVLEPSLFDKIQELKAQLAAQAGVR
jgi:hypothetical protein